MKKITLFIYSAISAAALLISGCSSIPKDEQGDFMFRDALRKKHLTYINYDAAGCPYNMENFSKKKGFMYYEDDVYRSRLGVDISRHDGDVDWKKVREAGIEFVILRCGYRGYQSGLLHQDSKFHDNIKAAHENGLDVGVYFFSQAITEEEALEEADFVLEQIKDYQLELPVVFDPENIPWDEARTDDVQGEVFTKNALVFCEKIKAAGFTPMIYSNMLWEAFKFDMHALKDYLFWYADYEKRPQSPYDYQFLQYSASGRIPGCTMQRTDLDIQLIKK